MDHSEYTIETVQLSKHYQDQVVVNQLNMHVCRGEIYGLLGRNGAGKTTTMRMLLNLARPTAGQILLFGQPHQQQLKATYQRIGSLVENPGLYENLTGRENLNLLARLRGLQRKDAVENALLLVGLEKEEKKLFGNYSLGMKQRLGIAAAVMHEPELLILDEPINGLDPIGIREMRQFFFNLSREYGTSILISSHVLSEVEQIADTIGVMHEGRLLEEVNLQELHRRNRQYVEFTLVDKNSENKACLLLEEALQFKSYSVHEHGKIRMYEHLEQRSQVNRLFMEHGLTVSDIIVSEDKLEDYFAKLIGVTHDA